jgi:hypothetical protein
MGHEQDRQKKRSKEMQNPALASAMPQGKGQNMAGSSKV